MNLRSRLKAIGYSLVAPAAALLCSLAIASAIVLAIGKDPIMTFETMVEYGLEPRTIVVIVNLAMAYYLSALAVAVGFRMNLFNIGVDGQYRLAAMLAAAVGGAVTLPGPLEVVLILVVAVAVGAMWAGLAGLLKVTRGVDEVISTIMLNFIATGLVAFLLAPGRLAEHNPGSENIQTSPIPSAGHVPGLSLVPGADNPVFGMLILVVLCGVGVHFLFNRTRFGFDLRAVGQSPTAAEVSGVNVKKMVLTTMLISGGLAGLVAMPQLLGESYSYGLDFPAGFGFIGIAIALLGRNNPIGIAFGALLWAFLDSSAQILELEGISKEIVTIMQGSIVLSVVIAYEVVKRYRTAAERRWLGARTEGVAT